MPASSRILVLGNKMWSSWSLRPWLLMRTFGLPFEEATIALRTPRTAADIAARSPSGKVPALIDDGLTIWDSLAIAEYLADAHPDLAIWPREKAARAIARSVSAEMHSGFQGLRQNCPMDFNARGLVPADGAAIAADVARIAALWRDCRAQFGAGGPFLFGAFSASDAMYAPVVSRFTSYDLANGGEADDGVVGAYMAAVWSLPGMTEWAEGARAEQAGRP